MLEPRGLSANATATSTLAGGSAVCIGLSALPAVRRSVKSVRLAATYKPHGSRPRIVAATSCAALFLFTSVAAGIGLLASHRQAAADNGPAVTISVEDLQRRIDTQALPLTEVSDHM